ncbi:MAG: Gfo/Idh/MocA family oxidoreductase [Alphaproteobacteria bacterium]|nr:Gfo/Idh/MocA family oxidoreductase [Alphaproteobacteria bacterium]
MSGGELRQLRLGVTGLGRAFTLMLPTLQQDERIKLVAAADPRREACARFAAEFGAHAYPTVEALCADPQVEVVYVATPHQLHAEHACAAAHAGKHLLVEKPMAIALAECEAMIRAARENGVHLMVGHSHSFDAPCRRARELIASGRFGRLGAITALNFTDFM